MKIMGLDIGDRSVGIAVSDPGRTIAFPVENYVRVSLKKDIEHLVDLIVKEGIDRVVAGMPYNMNGTLGPQGEKTKAFIKALAKKLRYSDRLNSPVEIVEWDERLTSKAAEKALLSLDMRRENRKKHIDMVAGTMILQSYLDNLNIGGKENDK